MLTFIFLIIFMTFDVFYFIRFLGSILVGKFLRKKIKFLEPSTVYSICWLTDVDFLMTHMNNARYLREFDFARFDYFTRSGFFDEMRKIDGGNVPMAASSVRYRQPLWVFSPYKIVSCPVWWDEKNLYFEQKVITLMDGIVRNVAYLKLAGVKLNLDELTKKIRPDIQKPECPDDLKKWMESNEISSQRMKKSK